MSYQNQFGVGGEKTQGRQRYDDSFSSHHTMTSRITQQSPLMGGGGSDQQRRQESIGSLVTALFSHKCAYNGQGQGGAHTRAPYIQNSRQHLGQQRCHDGYQLANTQDSDSDADFDDSSPYYTSANINIPIKPQQLSSSCFTRASQFNADRIRKLQRKRRNRLIAIVCLLVLLLLGTAMAAVVVPKPSQHSKDLYRGERVLYEADGKWIHQLSVEGRKVQRVLLFREQPPMTRREKFSHEMAVDLSLSQLSYYRIAAYDGSALSLKWGLNMMPNSIVNLQIIEGQDGFNRLQKGQLLLGDREMKMKLFGVEPYGTVNYTFRSHTGNTRKRAVYFIVFQVKTIPLIVPSSQSQATIRIGGSAKLDVDLLTFDTSKLEPAQSCDEAPCQFVIAPTQRFLLIDGPDKDYTGAPGYFYYEEHARLWPYFALFGTLCLASLLVALLACAVYIRKSYSISPQSAQNSIINGNNNANGLKFWSQYSLRGNQNGQFNRDVDHSRQSVCNVRNPSNAQLDSQQPPAYNEQQQQ
ncbi:hypothetical protein MIR68_007657 [Amoeboaphelidium protococcarum]|nr:hypothetical protein MIR68_007657 [Amoeboaphelidium protococcarum]